MRVAVASVAALGNQHAFVELYEVVKHLSGFVVVDDGAHGNGNLDIFAVASMAIAAFAVAAAFGSEDVIVAEFQEGVLVAIGDEVDVAAVAAITAAGSALWHELLAAEGNAAMTAVACFDCDLGFVDEQGLFDRLNRDESSRRALILELNNAGNLREERVVFADADIEAGFELRSALAHENRAAGYELSGKALHSEPLGMTVAPVS